MIVERLKEEKKIETIKLKLKQHLPTRCVNIGDMFKQMSTVDEISRFHIEGFFEIEKRDTLSLAIFET